MPSSADIAAVGMQLLRMLPARMLLLDAPPLTRGPRAHLGRQSEDSDPEGAHFSILRRGLKLSRSSVANCLRRGRLGREGALRRMGALHIHPPPHRRLHDELRSSTKEGHRGPRDRHFHFPWYVRPDVVYSL
jgi:hypothetical protein